MEFLCETEDLKMQLWQLDHQVLQVEKKGKSIPHIPNPKNQPSQSPKSNLFPSTYHIWQVNSINYTLKIDG